MAEKLQLEITLENGQFKVQAADTKKTINGLGDGMAAAGTKGSTGIKKLKTGMASLKTLMKGFLALQVVRFFYNIGKAALKSSAEMESTQIAFTTMLGSAEKAKKLLGDIRKFSAATPLQFKGLAENTKLLLAFGIEGEKVMGILKDLGDVSGGNQEKLNSLALAFGQMSSTGKLMGQDLLQMINAGFNPLQEISRTTGESVSDLKVKMSQGAITVDMVRGAFKSAAGEGGRFYKMLEKQSKSLSGTFSTLKDRMMLIVQGMGDEMAPAFKELIGLFSDASDEGGGLEMAFRGLGWIIGKIVLLVSSLVNDLMSMINTTKRVYFEIKRLKLLMTSTHSEGASLKKRKELAEVERDIVKTKETQNKLMESASRISQKFLGTYKEEDLTRKSQLETEKGITKETKKQQDIKDKPDKKKKKKGKGPDFFFSGVSEGEKEDFLQGLEEGGSKIGGIQKFLGGRAELFQAQYDGIVNIAQDAANRMNDIWEMQHQQDLQRLGTRYDFARAYIMANVADEEERAAALQNLQTMQDIHEKLLERRAAIRQKKLKMMEATTSMISGAAGAFAMGAATYPPPYGLIIGAVAAATTLAIGGAYVAQIARTPLPAFAQGVLDVPSDMMANIHRGESVLTAPITESLKKNEIAITGPGGGGNDKMMKVTTVINLDSKQIGRQTDTYRTERARSMGVKNYSESGVY